MNLYPSPDSPDNETKILLIDDRQDKKQYFERILNKPGYAFVKVCSSVEGFRRLMEENFELILLHVMTEIDNAIDLIKRFARMCDIPVVVVE